MYLTQDDVIDEVGELIAAAECLKDNGAYKIYAAATHGVLSKNAPELIDQSPIDEVRNKTHTTPLTCSIPCNYCDNVCIVRTPLPYIALYRKHTTTIYSIVS